MSAPPKGGQTATTESRRLGVLLVGAGGQGVLTAARMLGDAAHGAGIPVVVGQLHGMSQRGGSVECTVLLGPGRSSFLTGSADVVVGFEPLEVVRVRERLRSDTHVVINRGTVVPYLLSRAGETYPPFDTIAAEIGAITDNVTVVDGPSLLADVGEKRTLNVMMLGALAGLGILPFDAEALWQSVAARSPKKFLHANRRAMEIGVGLAG